MTKKPTKIQVSCYLNRDDYNELVRINPDAVQENIRQGIKMFLLSRKRGNKLHPASHAVADMHNDLSEDHLMNSIVN